MSTITPAKALKLKNSLVKEISSLQEKIQSYNSYQVGAEVPYDSKNLLTNLESKVQELITLKTALSKANGPIQEKIYKIGELKSLISRLKGISTTSGKVAGHRFSGNTEPVEYKATITTLQLEDIIVKKEKEIEILQEEIDQFNHTTLITL